MADDDRRNDPEQPEEEVPVDDLESITEGLPTGEEDSDSMTPEEALAALIRETSEEEEEPPARNPGRRKRKRREGASTPMPDELDDRVHARNLKEGHPVLRRVINTVITVLLLFIIVIMIFARIVDFKPLSAVEDGVSTAMTPIQSFFAGVTDTVTGYFRTLKRRANLEAEYNRVVAENEQLVYLAKQAESYRIRLEQYEDISAEVKATSAMQSISCSVIGRDEGNYFSTFTINRGSDDGIKPYMAVIRYGALIGYTETVSETRSTVRTIIDSEASIAGIIESSRDQGTVRGTLGIDRSPMCRMYYLPENHLPRPGDSVVTSGVGMSFPKGIPIGTVRESTRGLEGNKQYVVVEPAADFQHIEYVIVLRYQPDPEPVTAREGTRRELVPLESPRPVPTFRSGAGNYWTTAPPSADGEVTETPPPTATPTPEPSPSPSPTPSPTPDGTSESLTFVIYNKPTPTPSPPPTPSPTPRSTFSPGELEE